MIKTELAVGGMTCGACSSAVTSALTGTDGVVDATVSLVTERAVVMHPDSVSPEALKTAIEDAGFDAKVVKSVPDTPEKSDPTKIKIGGMTCGACTSSVTAALEQVPGVTAVTVSLITELAVVTHDASVEKTTLIQAVEDAGFDAEVLGEAKQVELKVFGGSDVVEQVTHDLVNTTGVNVATFKDDLVTISYDPRLINLRKLIRGVEQGGAYAVLASTADNAQQVAALQRVKEIVGYKRDMVVCIALGVPTMALHKLHHHLPSFFTARLMPGLWVDDIISILLVAPIQFMIGRPFYVKSFKALRARSPTMDVLVTFSTSCAFIYSLSLLLYCIITRKENRPMYLWDTCAMIFTFVVIGKFLENSARGSTSQALSSLLSLVPERATLINEDGRHEDVPTDMLDIGDKVLVRPGEKVCADGVVVEGESHVSEAMLTGESAPVLKQPGDTVIGGTLNGQGSLTFEVTSCGNDTKLAQIVDLVKDAQNSRAPIQRYADSIAAVFVPSVIALALTTFVCWYCLASWLPRPPAIFADNKFLVCLRLCISVIVVACPCALGLATPTAVMVGTGVGAEHGILVKAGAVFEQLGNVKVVLFDKTGTLTTGHIRVVSTDVPDKWWPAIRAIERLSEHPAGKALASYYPAGTGPTNDTESHPVGFEVELGRGVRATVDKHEFWIGAGATNGVLVRVDGQIVGTVQVQDALRSDAASVVEQLQTLGYIVGVVSGDSAASVESLAAQVGIDSSRAWSGMMPTDKVRVIEDLQSQGMAVTFVGDGINDSPALVAAAVGISIEGATHVAVESADVVLVQKSPIRAVTATLDLGKSTLRRIKLNLLGSVIYNAVAIPFAMGLLLPWGMMLSPTAASAAMAASSVTVVVSSTMLKRWRPKYVDEEDLEAEPKAVSASLWQRFRRAFSFGFTKRQSMPSYERVSTNDA